MRLRVTAILVLILLLPFLTGATIIIRGPVFAGSSGPVGTAPDDITGLVAWYKTPIAGASDNTEIASWPDSAGSYTADGSTNGVYQTSELNGYAVVEFSNDETMQTSLGSGTYPYTMFAVIKVTDLTAGATIFGSSSTGDIHFYVGSGTTTGALAITKQFVTVIGESTDLVTENTWTVVVGRVTSTTYKFWVGTGTPNSGSHSVVLGGTASFWMGYHGSSGGDKFIGQIAEAGIYNTSVSDGDVDDLIAHLENKYGL